MIIRNILIFAAVPSVTMYRNPMSRKLLRGKTKWRNWQYISMKEIF